MMLYSSVCALLLTVCIFAQDIDVPGRQPNSWTPNGANIDKSNKQIFSNFAGLRNAKNAKLRASQGAHANLEPGNALIDTQAGQELVARRNKDATGAKGDSTSVGLKRKSGTPLLATGALHKGAGGEVNTNVKGGKNGQGQWTRLANGENDANFESQGRKAKTHGYGADGKDRFDFNNEKGTIANIDPSVQTKTDGNGNLDLDRPNAKQDGNYTYIIKNANKQSSQASMKDRTPTAGRSTNFDWTCTGDGTGQSTCKNARGETVGKAYRDGQNQVTIQDKNGNPVGRGQAQKMGNKNYQVNINRQRDPKSGATERDPQYVGSAKNESQYDCYQEVAKKADPVKDDVKILKPYTFKYSNQKNSNGTTTYQFPDCFKIGAQIELAPGVDVKTLALEFRVRLNPMGDLKCADPGVCGRECYYCGICDPDNIKYKLVDNVDNKAVCQSTGGRRYSTEVTVCPPPDGQNVPICAKFERSYSSDYWLKVKANALEVKVLVWQRPKKEQDLINEYMAKKDDRNWRQLQVLSYYATNVQKGSGVPSGFAVDDNVLMEYYIRNQLLTFDKDKKEELLTCRAGTIDYDLFGSKAGGKFLVEASDKLKNGGSIADSIYTAPPCSAVDKVQKDEYNQQYEAWVKAGKPGGSSGFLSGLSGLLGRGKK